MSTGKRIIDLPPATPLLATDLIEVSQFVTGQVSGKVTLADLTTYFNNTAAGLPNVLNINNNTGGNDILLTSGDAIKAATNSYATLYLEPTFNSLSTQDPTSNEQFFGQYISGAGGSYTQISSTDIASGNYTNIQMAQEIGVLNSLNAGLGYNTQLEWSPSVWKINSSYSTFAGLQYNADYSANYTNRSLIDKGYAAATFAVPTTIILPQYGGTGIANNAASTLTISGAFASTFTVTGAFTYTFPTATSTLLGNNLGLSGGSTLVGGTAVGDALNLKGTSGNGTSSVAAINFLVGNNGATNAGKIYNAGNWNLGNAAAPGGVLSTLRVGNGTSFIDFGQGSAAFPAIWFQQATPTATNYTINGDEFDLLLNSSVSTQVRFNNVACVNYTNQNTVVATSFLTFSKPSITNQTTGAERSFAVFTSGAFEWAGSTAIATNRNFYITSPTYTSVSGTKQFTDTFNLYVEQPTISTNVASTNNWAAGFDGNVKIISTTTNKQLKIYNTAGTIIAAHGVDSGGGFSGTISNHSFRIIIQNGVSTPVTYSATTAAWAVGVATSGNASAYTFTVPNSTGQTLSTAVPQLLYTLGNTQWATGALAATQPFFSITQPTISFVGSSTATLTATLSIAGAPNSGTNAIQTTAVGLLVQSAAVNGTGTVGTSYGAYINAQTGATTNYALGVSGGTIFTDSTTLRVGAASSQIGLSFTGSLSLADFALWGTSNTVILNSNTTLSLRISNTAQIIFTSLTATLTDALNFVGGSTTGHKFMTATSQKMGFWNATPIVQPASANQAAVTTTVATTASTNVAPYGYTTQAQADDLITEVGQLKVLTNQLRSDLVSAGLIKGSA